VAGGEVQPLSLSSSVLEKKKKKKKNKKKKKKGKWPMGDKIP
jgi:hypothetical protein